MKAADLRKAILQYAVEGKLVPQDNQDEPASILYEKIIVEKENLIKQGKIKKEKPLPPITDDEIPYDIPNNWKWVRLGNITTLINGDRSSKYPSDLDIQHVGIPFINAKNIINDRIDLKTIINFITEEKFMSLNSGKLLNNDIVFVLRGSVGKHGIFYIDAEYKTGFINAQLIIIRSIMIVTKYLNYIFDTEYFIKLLNDNATGSAVKQLPHNILANFPIPLPPLKEQERIVKKVDELLTYCEKLKNTV